MRNLIKILLLKSILVLPILLNAQDCKTYKDGVVMRDGKLLTFDKSGALVPLTEDKELSNGTKVLKSGEYKTTAGAKSKLKNGEILTSKGDLLILSEFVVIMEGATIKDGKACILKEGNYSPLSASTDFGDGLKFSIEGSVTLKDGSTIELKEGELVTSSGEFIRKKDDIFIMDGVAIRGGKAMKWDQGKYVPLTADMNLGTSGAKVNTSGTVTSKDGSSFKLNEGSMISSKGELAFAKSDLVGDGVFKRDGSMYQIKEGKISPLTSEYTLTTGGKVSMDGKLIFSASEKMDLREGELVLASGEVILLKANKVDANAISERKTTDHYIFRGGKMMLVKDGEPQILQADITFPSGSKLLKHGHVVKKDGAKHILKEGEKLDINGNFIVDKSKSDYDEKNHLVMKQAKVFQVKDGKEFPLTAEVLMPDWSKIYPDGTVEKQNGTKTKMKDGERFNMEGEPMSKISTGTTASTAAPANTSQTLITMKAGKLVILMSGKELPMSKERILNNGTKIAIDGNVSRKDGTSFKMKEGDKVDYNTGEPIK